MVISFTKKALIIKWALYSVTIFFQGLRSDSEFAFEAKDVQ